MNYEKKRKSLVIIYKRIEMNLCKLYENSLKRVKDIDIFAREIYNDIVDTKVFEKNFSIPMKGEIEHEEKSVSNGTCNNYGCNKLRWLWS